MSERYKSINQISEMLDKDRRTLKKKLIDIPIHSTKGKAELYDMSIAMEAIYGVTDKNDINKQLLSEQLRYEEARADKMILEVEQRRGEVVNITEVAKAVASEYSNVRARILSIPSRCAKDLSLEFNPALVKERLDQEVSEALAELTADTKYEESENVEQLNSTPETDESEGSEATSET